MFVCLVMGRFGPVRVRRQVLVTQAGSFTLIHEGIR